MKTLLAFAAAGLLALAASQPAAGQTAHTGTVVELFTSQGCNSCPPADAFLGELAKRDDLIALTYHVDYWDYLGWPDTFASPDYTARQRNYAAAMRERRVYTPQMVVGGSAGAVGSHRARVAAEIEAARRAGTQYLQVELARENDYFVVRLPDSRAHEEATIWLVRYDRVREVAIRRGENGGRTLKYYNVVRQLTNLGLWNGKAREISYMVDDMTKGGRDGCAVIVQRGSHGPVIGAAAMDFDPQS